MATPKEPRIPQGDAPHPTSVAGLPLSIPATSKPSMNAPQSTAPARPASDSATPQPNILIPNPSATKTKGKYSSRVTFLSPTIRDFTALRDELLKLSRPIKSDAMNAIIEELRPLIEDPVKSDLIDFMWEIRMRLNTTLSSMLKDLGNFDKMSQSRRYQDDPESPYSKGERKKARESLKKDMVPLEQILRPYFVKKLK